MPMIFSLSAATWMLHTNGKYEVCKLLPVGEY
jgi:hypothetical protein